MIERLRETDYDEISILIILLNIFYDWKLVFAKRIVIKFQFW